MTQTKKQRVANAVGFLSGLLACLDALREASGYWPPNVVWIELSHPRRLELGGGIALMVVTLIISVVRRDKT